MEIRFLGKVLLWWRSGICAMWGILWANPAGSANSGSWAGVLGCSSLFSFCSTEFNLFLQMMFMPLPVSCLPQTYRSFPYICFIF